MVRYEFNDKRVSKLIEFVVISFKHKEEEEEKKEHPK